MDDWTLLEKYLETGSEEAFGQIVARHIDRVYSSACRQLDNSHAAEEVTQAVFILLARKAAKLGRDTILSAWLLQATRYVVRDALRKDIRRQEREREAVAMQLDEPTPSAESAWQEIAPLLDEGIASLNPSDRNAVVLRFFENKSHQEIARALDLNETAAKKRVSRAVERLRRFFAKRGLALPAGALSATVATHAAQSAPAGLAATVTASAIGQGLNATAATIALVDGASKLMVWAKAKIALAVVGVLLVGTTVLVETTRDRGRFHLANGTTIELYSVAYGSGFRLSVQSFSLGGTLDRWLSRAVRERFGRSTGTASIGLNEPTGFECLFVSVRAQNPNGTLPPAWGLTLSDADGNQSEVGIGAGTAGFPNEGYHIFRFPAFPRRTKTLRLQFHEIGPNYARGKVLAHFSIANPRPGPHPVWTPDRHPVQTNGNLVVALTGFRTGVPNTRMPHFAKANQANATVLAFRIRENGRSDQPWRARAVEVSDATGNHWRPFLPPATTPNPESELTLSFAGSLWPGETAWKLRVELSRIAEFSDKELWELPNVPIPEPDTADELAIGDDVPGTTIEAAAIAAPNAEMPEAFRGLKSDCPTLAIRGSESGQGKRLTLLRVVDNRGKSVPFDEPDWREGSDRIFFLHPAEGAHHLHFTFAIHASRFVEFTAKPEQVQTVARQP